MAGCKGYYIAAIDPVNRHIYLHTGEGTVIPTWDNPSSFYNADFDTGYIVHPGDVNGDGLLTEEDRNLIIEYLANWELDNFDIEVGDVNGDNTVTGMDISMILQYLRGSNTHIDFTPHCNEFSISSDGYYHWVFAGQIIEVSGNRITYSRNNNLDSTDKWLSNVDNGADPMTFFIPAQPDYGTTNVGLGSHAEGYETHAAAQHSHAEGYASIVAGRYGHAEGHATRAGFAAHAEGKGTLAAGLDSHAEGSNTKAIGSDAHAEGSKTEAVGLRAHAEGYSTHALSDNSHAEGQDTYAENTRAHAEGYQTKAKGTYSHSEGGNTTAYDKAGHSEGLRTTSLGLASHAEGYSTNKASDKIIDLNIKTSFNNIKTAWDSAKFSAAVGDGSHVEGNNTLANKYAHAEGDSTIANGISSHAEGCGTKASGIGSHAEGGSQDEYEHDLSFRRDDRTDYILTSSGDYSHAEGCGTLASGNHSHAEGYYNIASGEGAHAEGYSAIDECVKGGVNIASGKGSHAEGVATEASGYAAHAEGGGYLDPGDIFMNTTASGDYSHAEGFCTIASGQHQHAQGRLNLNNNQYAHIVGNGTIASGDHENYYESQDRSNAHTLTWEGLGWFAQGTTSAGADYAEYFEWLDGNINNEDRVGYVVTLEGDKIRLAFSDDEILGIISGTAAVLGDNTGDAWKKKYLTDDFGRIIYETVEMFDKKGNSLGEVKKPRINPDFDPSLEYIPRENRPEWDAVGMLGKLHVRDDGSCQVNGYAKVGIVGTLTHSETKTNMRVLSRVSDNVVLVLVK